MPPETLSDEEEYVSSEDSDFAPDAAGPGRDSSGESDDNDDDGDEGGGGGGSGDKPKAKRKSSAGDGRGDEAEDAGFENSGDEAIIEKGKKKRRKGKDKHGEVGEDDEGGEGGEGGLIKTRSQRAVEKAERKAAVAKGPVTIDVDALWARMTSSAVWPTNGQDKPQEAQQGGAADAKAEQADGQAQKKDGATGAGGNDDEPSQMIKMKRTYNFAGKVHTEEKLVARDSAEAKLYLASLGKDGEAASADDPAARAMPRTAFRSAFEPPLLAEQIRPRADLNLGLGVLRQARELAAKDPNAAKKLNTVEKSRMDWAGFVDKEGIKDELVLAGKSKASYAARQDFLARSEALREEDARRARMAGRA